MSRTCLNCRFTYNCPREGHKRYRERDCTVVNGRYQGKGFNPQVFMHKTPVKKPQQQVSAMLELDL